MANLAGMLSFMNMKTLLPLALVLCAAPARADWNPDLAAGLADAAAPAAPSAAAAAPALGAPFAPELVSDPAAFALTAEDVRAAEREVPDAAGALGAKLAGIMRRAYVGGAAPAAFDGTTLRVMTWNLNAPKTKREVDAMLAAFSNDPEGVRAALGRRKPVAGKAVAALGKVSETEVFLIQEVPLPTAIALAKALGCQVFWAPEFVEVGDNAKGFDPAAGLDFTGNAILSRVPLSDFRLLRFSKQADWYYSQKGVQPFGDKLAKLAAKILFAVDQGNPHQTRPPAPYGGRLALFARAAAPSAGAKDLWIADLHLEDLSGAGITGPQLRRAQMAEALGVIRQADVPVVFGGDFNTMGGSVGVGEAEDVATEVPNVMHPGQPPVGRQHGYAPGVGNKFMGVIDAGNLATTLTHDPGSRKGLVARQAAAVAIGVAPYGPTIKDGLNATKKIKAHPSAGRIALYGGETAADFFPYTAPVARGFEVYRDEKARHDPSSRFNEDHKLFGDVKELGARPLNPRTGFRFGMGGYKSTWASGRPMGLVDTVVDWLYLYDPSGAMPAPKRGEVLKPVVEGTKAGAKPDQRLSDHYPVRVALDLRAP